MKNLRENLTMLYLKVRLAGSFEWDTLCTVSGHKLVYSIAYTIYLRIQEKISINLSYTTGE